MLQEYIVWAKKNGGITETQIQMFKYLSKRFGYNVDPFAGELRRYKIPIAVIIKSMRRDLGKGQFKAKPETV